MKNFISNFIVENFISTSIIFGLLTVTLFRPLELNLRALTRLKKVIKKELRRSKVLMKSLNLVIVAVACNLLLFSCSKGTKPMDRINAYFPFVFSQNVDPRNIITVGDQVICEHLYAFHAKESLRGGFGSVYSDVDIDFEKKVIRVTPSTSVVTSNGRPLGIKDFCSSFEESVFNSHHIVLKPLIKKVRCLEKSFEVHFTDIPINIKYLFTLADFSIFMKDQLPIEKNSKTIRDVTGPYRYLEFKEGFIHLTPNPNYKQKLRANSVKDVYLKSYFSEDTNSFINSLDTTKHHLAYLYGYALTKEHLSIIKSKGFKVRQMPSEWVVYIGMNKSVPRELRSFFYLSLQRQKTKLMKQAPLGQKAYGISPYNRSFGVKEDTFLKMISQTKEVQLPAIKKRYVLATLDEWSEIPFFKEILNYIKIDLSTYVEVRLYPRKDINKIWSSEVDMNLTPLGIAQADPLSSFAFLTELRDIISDKDILNASIQGTQDKFNASMLKLEEEIIKDRRMFPLGHFPGVVIESPLLERNDDLSWGWGIQTWTYKLR
ncbi:MAG: hypothetical protein ISR65_03840 [Bacteriovoracaceae bacterium]|nr:hypothetical protein [Bacteriovoracaceae bacterium]